MAQARFTQDRQLRYPQDKTGIPASSLRGKFSAWLLRKKVEEHFRNYSSRHDFLPIPGGDPGRGNVGSGLPEWKIPPRPAPGEPRGAPLSPDKVLVVGAGAAGLYLAMMLKYLSIPYDIVEAASVPGGRVLTHTFRATNANGEPIPAAAHNYYDIGAMRFPNIPAMQS